MLMNPLSCLQVAPEELPSEESLAGRKLVILGIPWETHAETLKTYFSQFGTVQVLPSTHSLLVAAQTQQCICISRFRGDAVLLARLSWCILAWEALLRACSSDA